MKKPNIKTIVVPIDFSKLSKPAIETAKDLARRFDATIHLAHVHEFYYPPGFIAPLPLSIIAYRDDAATRRTGRLRMLAKKNGLAVENCHFLDGAPTFNEICNLARQISADLIVMPTRGYTGLAHLFSGSTAERIVQHSPCPVLVTRPKKMAGRISSDGKVGNINTILVPVDFSEFSFQALKYAIEFAERVVAKLVIFHAAHFGHAFTADGYGMYDLSTLIEAARKDIERQMEKFVRLAKFRRVKFETAVQVGPPVSEICAFAEQRDVDLIIMATHGRTGFKHLLIGSVAEQVVRYARRPVLVVPSHPEVRATRLSGGTRRAQKSTGKRAKSQASLISTKRLTKRNRKLVAHAFPERRKTNKFRESHSF
jgi:nucleotide-binding universal stress UspA family protein